MPFEGVIDFSNVSDWVMDEVVLFYRFQTSSSVYGDSQGSLMSTIISFGVYDFRLVSVVCVFENLRLTVSSDYGVAVGRRATMPKRNPTTTLISFINVNFYVIIGSDG